MREEQTVAINFIFYLQSKDELDNNFYLMAEVLSKISISLLPISAEELKNLDRNKKYHLISIRNDYSSALIFNQLKKDFLETALNAGKISLFDISSFSQIENAAKLEVKNIYRYFQLPQNLKQIAMTVAVDFFRDRNARAEWPGGKRSKLPAINKENI